MAIKKSIKKLTKEEIAEINKKAFDVIDKFDVKKGRRSESEEFLLEIKEVIGKAISKGIPFTQISVIIEEMYKIKVSVNILKHFAKNHLNYVPKSRNRATTDLVEKASEANENGTRKMTIDEMKEQQNNSNNFE